MTRNFAAVVFTTAQIIFASPNLLAQESQTSFEPYLHNIRQLTFGGQNAEGYFSFDESRIIFQSTRDSLACDQEFILHLNSLETRLVSTGQGKTTCGYFLPGDSTILFSSTHASMKTCPPPPDYSRGYVWPVYASFDVYMSDTNGRNIRPLFASPGYDAEATVSPRGDRIVFTSSVNGDLDLFSMKLDGTDIRQLTHEPGYDGGAFFSWDGTKIVYRAWHYTDEKELAAYRDLLSQDLVRPTRMELFVMNADGSGKTQITNNGAANFAPFFHPDGKRVIFASNMEDPRGRNFDLYMVSIDGNNVEKVTHNDTFDGFPMFTRDGKRIIFASNRNGKVRGETNLFLADWKE